MFQDLKGHNYYCEYVPREPKEEDLIFFEKDKKILLRQSNDGLAFFAPNDTPSLFNGECSLKYLFKIDDVCFFMAEGTLSSEGEKNLYSQEKLRRAMAGWESFGGVCALHLACWYKRRRFCPKCGERAMEKLDERAMICPACGNVEYPMIAPALIVGVKNKDKLLLSKYAGKASSYHRHSLIAGFAEIGETLEDAARREVMEETGLKIKNLRYYKSQPWGFSGSLLMGFFAELDGSDKIKIDPLELSEAQWFQRDELPKDDDTYSLTWTMIEAFRNGEIE